jgi:hypothetical protein
MWVMNKGWVGECPHAGVPPLHPVQKPRRSAIEIFPAMIDTIFFLGRILMDRVQSTIFFTLFIF